MGAPQDGHSFAAWETTALHSSHSFGRGSLRSRARWSRTLPLPTVVEMVLTDIRHEAEPEMVAGMIEDQKMVLALGRAEAPTDGLDEENPAFGRTRENDAAHVEIDRRSSARRRCR